MKKLFTVLGLVGIYAMTNLSNVSAQDKPFRIGLKIGYPQLVGLNLEYVTPLLNKKLSADLDFSYFSFNTDPAPVKYTNFAIGADYYLIGEGRGIYLGLAYGRSSFSASEDVISTDPGTLGQVSTAKASVGINTFNLKIGGKHGGLFYFRWELGYRVGPKNLDLVETATFPGGYTQTNTQSLPISGSGPIADIGFGLAF